MIPLQYIFGVLLASALVAQSGIAFQPEFAEPLENLTVAVGRDATFRCTVQHLGGYRVGWVKADTKAIQAIHDHVITHNPRVSVSHSDHSTWNLHVRSVQEEDRGQYMCQINTDPMKSQMGHLDVVVPPDFVNEETSSDVMVPEGGTAKLTCKARGYPTPHVTWRREDNGEIVVKEAGGKTKVTSYQGEVLKLPKITRGEMGAYLCIASNGIPPSVSKRILVNVHFHPVIQVPNQLVGAPTATDVTLECYVEASPKSINYWVRDSGEMVISSEKYEVQSVTKSLFEVKMILIIRGFNKPDVGSYRCIAKNSLGEVESNIRLYEIPGPTRKVYQGPPDDEEDQNYEVYGSAEEEGQDEISNSVQVVAGWGDTPTSSGVPSKGTFNTVQVLDGAAPSSASRHAGTLNTILSAIYKTRLSIRTRAISFSNTSSLWKLNVFFVKTLYFPVTICTNLLLSVCFPTQTLFSL
ncbi:lachesin-like [Macrosteles quadrilineatus]|uniref:lachesin-like n=1 Tax=Macrosteles quadrilineatus TaxID=74068 RepID=UPI0023E22DC1|nr:lachesin-like [Macrosteles quadrilineatus]